MRLALTWFVKEWRAQRAPLAAYVAVSFAVIAAIFALRTFTPGHSGSVPMDVRANVVALFLAAASFGVAGLVAPQVVRGEVCGNADHFLRRLPGALRPALAGKLAFLALAAGVLPALAVVAAQGLLVARGVAPLPLSWLTLDRLGSRLRQVGAGDLTLAGSCLALAAAPLVVAAAACLPRARMAFGLVTLLGLLLALLVQATLSAHPNLAQGIRHDGALSAAHGIAYAVALGLLVAWFAVARGRRGGGPLRSARLGGLALLVGLLPPAAWLGSWVRVYRVPDLHGLQRLLVYGLTPDLRYMLAEGAGSESWPTQPLRIDLRTGAVDRLGAVGDACLWPHVLQRGTPQVGSRQRYWRLHRNRSAFVLDATTLGCVPLAFDAVTKHYVPPPGLAPELANELALRTPFRAPGDRRAWVDGDALCVEGDRGEVIRSTVDPRDVLLWPCGHGAVVARNDGERGWLDLTTRRFVAIDHKATSAFAVRGRWFVRDVRGAWQGLNPQTGIATPVAALSGEVHVARMVGLLDDDTVLVTGCERLAGRRGRWRLFTYSVGTGVLAPIQCDGTLPGDVVPFGVQGTAYGLRDRRGCLWSKCQWWRADGSVSASYITIDPTTRTASATAVGDVDILAFLDEHSLLASTTHRVAQHRASERQAVTSRPLPDHAVHYSWAELLRRVFHMGDDGNDVVRRAWRQLQHEYASVVRIDIATGAQTVLFPRAP